MRKPRISKLYSALLKAQAEFQGLDFQSSSVPGVYKSSFTGRQTEWAVSSRMWRRRLHLCLHEVKDVEMKRLWSVSIARVRTADGDYIYSLYDAENHPLKTHPDLHVMLTEALTAAVMEMTFEYKCEHLF